MLAFDTLEDRTGRCSVEYQHIAVDERDGFVAITMRRPERRNALSEPHLSELLHAFRVTGASKSRGIATHESADDAHCGAHKEAACQRNGADHQRYARTVEHARPDIPSGVVGAKNVIESSSFTFADLTGFHQGWRDMPVTDASRIGVMRGKCRREYTRDYKGNQYHHG